MTIIQPYKLKLVLIGDTGVGKTSVVQRMVYNCFSHITSTTIGAAFQTIPVGDKFRIDVWDTAGQERFRSIIPMYLKSCHIALIVVNANENIETIHHQIQFWTNFINNNSAYMFSEYKTVLVFNKIDILPDFVIPPEFLNDSRFAHVIGVSAKTNTNMDELKKYLDKCCIAIDKSINISIGSTQTSKKIDDTGSWQIPGLSHVNTVRDYYNNSRCAIL